MAKNISKKKTNFANNRPNCLKVTKNRQGVNLQKTKDENGKVVTTTFTGDNEITETIVNGGVTSTRVTTLSENEEGNIIETIVEGDKTTIKKTIFNSDGSIDEQII